MKGAPLWVAAAVVGGWITGRVVALLPAGSAPRIAIAGRAEASVAMRTMRAPGVVAASFPAFSADGYPQADDQPARLALPAARPVSIVPNAPAHVAMPPHDATAVTAPSEPVAAETPRAATSDQIGTQPAMFGAGTPRASRLHGDAWAIARPRGGDNLAFGQLGGAQAGVRFTYAVDETRRVALSARFSTPRRGRGREAAAGLDWQPGRLPVHLLVEARVPVDGGAVRPAVQLIGGVARRLPFGLDGVGYAQAGAVARRGGFADGSVRVSRTVAGRGWIRVDVGGGGWAAAQRAVARIDIGPELGIVVPTGGAAFRLAVDYRLRVAGRARPGSGPALTLGSSF